MNCKLLTILLTGLALFPQHQPRLAVHVESLEYPPNALLARIQGDVTVHAAVEADGQVRTALVSSGTLLLGDPAIDNVTKWKFEPGEKEYIDVNYHFELTQPEVRNPQTICEFDLPNTVTVIANLHVPDH
jgi:TonB family protein